MIVQRLGEGRAGDEVPFPDTRGKLFSVCTLQYIFGEAADGGPPILHETVEGAVQGTVEIHSVLRILLLYMRQAETDADFNKGAQDACTESVACKLVYAATCIEFARL